MKQHRVRLRWLAFPLTLAVLWANVWLVVRIFSLRGWWFSAALAAYFAVLALTLALILRKRELRRLSVELEMPKKEIPAYLRRLRRERRQKTN